MRMRVAVVVVGLLPLFAAGAADDDPVVNGVKLSEAIARFKAAGGNDEASVNKRGELAQAIAAYDAPKAYAFLGTVLREEKSAGVKINLMLALNRLGAKAKPLVPELTAALKDADPDVRSEAADTLGIIGPDAKSAAPALLALLKDAAQPAGVRAATPRALHAVGADAKEVVPVLKETVKEKDARLRMRSGLALYDYDKANAKVAVGVLREAIKDKATQMEAVLESSSLKADAKELIPDLIAQVKEGGVGGYYAPEALAKIPGAEDALVAALKDPDKATREAAAQALKKAFPAAAKKAGLVK